MTTTTVNATTQEGGVPNFASGSFTSDGNATIVNVGFTPRYVLVVNSTDVLRWEKLEGMAAADTWRLAAGSSGADVVTSTDNTSSNILINADGRTITLSATLVGTSKAISWIALG